MRFFEVTARNDVVEDHWKTNSAELKRLSALVLDLESQNQPAVVKEPRPSDLQGNV